jgi:pimeloyl-ACP methyl ester carboxylesterase
MKKDIPKFEFKVVDGEGHWLILHNPVKLDKAIGEFFEQDKYSQLGASFVDILY